GPNRSSPPRLFALLTRRHHEVNHLVVVAGPPIIRHNQSSPDGQSRYDDQVIYRTTFQRRRRLGMSSKVVIAQVGRERQIMTPSWTLGAISDSISTEKPAVIETALTQTAGPVSSSVVRSASPAAMPSRSRSR